MASIKSPRAHLQLISAQRDTELDLIEFLRPYKRLSADKVCAQPIDASQVSIWTFKGSVWTHGVPDRAVRNGSWCQSYLTSALNLSRVEYDRAKKELFSQTNGLNGVYKHKSQDLYAIVYRPQIWLTRKNIAAIAGGTALVGLGVAGTRYALRKPTEVVKTPSQPDPTEQRLDELYSKFAAVVQRDASMDRPSEEDLQDLPEYRKLLDEYKNKNGDHVAKFEACFVRMHRIAWVHDVRYLLGSNISLKGITSRSAFRDWNEVQAYVIGSKAPQNVMLRYEVAKVYYTLEQSLKDGNLEQGLNDLYEASKQCQAVCAPFIALEQFFRDCDATDFGSVLTDFLQSKEPELANLNELVALNATLTERLTDAEQGNFDSNNWQLYREKEWQYWYIRVIGEIIDKSEARSHTPDANYVKAVDLAREFTRKYHTLANLYDMNIFNKVYVVGDLPPHIQSLILTANDFRGEDDVPAFIQEFSDNMASWNADLHTIDELASRIQMSPTAQNISDFTHHQKPAILRALVLRIADGRIQFKDPVTPQIAIDTICNHLPLNDAVCLQVKQRIHST